MPIRSRISLARPFTDEEELAEIASVLASGQLAQGPKVEQFEAMVAASLDAKHAFATSSCTTALHLALVALGIGPGDEVLLPDFTFPATANVVVQQGAVPVLMDVDLATYNLDPSELERRVTPNVRAVIAVDLFGLSADMDPVREFAAARGIPVLEDAACAQGATYRGRPCGTLTEAGCFSFHPRKVITTGEGGMVLTNDDEVAARLRLYRSHGGARRGNRFTFEAAGFNYRLSDIQAAVGVVQMRRLAGLLQRRKALAAAYRSELDASPWITLPAEPPWAGHVYQSFVVLLDERLDRDAVMHALADQGVETTLGTYALHAQPFFQAALGLRPGDLPRSFAAFQRSLALPLHPGMDVTDVAVVADQLRQATTR